MCVCLCVCVCVLSNNNNHRVTIYVNNNFYIIRTKLKDKVNHYIHYCTSHTIYYQRNILTEVSLSYAEDVVVTMVQTIPLCHYCMEWITNNKNS